MQKKLLGKTGFMVSPIIYGGIVSMLDGQPASDRYVDYALDMGINYYDVAPVYDDAQEKLGNSLNGRRNGIYLACKTTTRTKEEGRREMEESFRLLKTDYFDVYQLHAVTTKEEIDIAFGKDGIMDFLFNAKKEGKIRNIGITGHSEEAVLYALSKYDFDTVMFPLNWNIHMKSNIGEELCRAKAENNYGILGMKNLIERAWQTKEERYSSKFPKSWCKPIDAINEEGFALAAMRYTFKMGADVLIPPGNIESFSFCVEHMDEAVKPFTEDDAQILNAKLSEFGHLPFLTTDKGMINESDKEL